MMGSWSMASLVCHFAIRWEQPTGFAVRFDRGTAGHPLGWRRGTDRSIVVAAASEGLLRGAEGRDPKSCRTAPGAAHASIRSCWIGRRADGWYGDRRAITTGAW